MVTNIEWRQSQQPVTVNYNATANYPLSGWVRRRATGVRPLVGCSPPVSMDINTID